MPGPSEALSSRKVFLNNLAVFRSLSWS
jgi:hypothetical protein